MGGGGGGGEQVTQTEYQYTDILGNKQSYTMEGNKLISGVKPTVFNDYANWGTYESDPTKAVGFISDGSFTRYTGTGGNTMYLANNTNGNVLWGQKPQQQQNGMNMMSNGYGTSAVKDNLSFGIAKPQGVGYISGGADRNAGLTNQSRSGTFGSMVAQQQASRRNELNTGGRVTFGNNKEEV
jgi:hypothetical protein